MPSQRMLLHFWLVTRQRQEASRADLQATSLLSSLQDSDVELVTSSTSYAVCRSGVGSGTLSALQWNAWAIEAEIFHTNDKGNNALMPFPRGRCYGNYPGRPFKRVVCRQLSACDQMMWRFVCTARTRLRYAAAACGDTRAYSSDPCKQHRLTECQLRYCLHRVAMKKWQTALNALHRMRAGT